MLAPPAPHETMAILERIGRNSVVVRRCDTDYGFCGESIKLFFDLDAKRILGRVELSLLTRSRMLTSRSGLLAFGFHVERERFNSESRVWPNALPTVTTCIPCLVHT